MATLNRRQFTKATALGLMAATSDVVKADEPSREVVLALMGANSRGSYLAKAFREIPGVRFAYVCDPDEKAIEKGIEAASNGSGPKVQGVKDFRHALDDPQVDALICAAPNHWHCAATVAACAAGKHVYVEKPCSHYPNEGELMIEAAKRSGKIVQVGMQRRSSPAYREAISKVKEGMLGNVLYAKSWYHYNRPSIGIAEESDPPEWLDFDLWQGPRPSRPYRDNLLHYNWHWFWHWGNGELGNNGVHTIDICRWAMEVDYPSRVSAIGGRIRYDDDQQTPDTLTAVFECDDKHIVWEDVSWSRPSADNEVVGIELRGTEGAMQLDDKSIKHFDAKGKLVSQEPGMRGDNEHFSGFIRAIQENRPPACNLDDGHKSALFCHLGNISYRTGQPIEVDPSNGQPLDREIAETYWQGDNRQGWIPDVGTI